MPQYYYPSSFMAAQGMTLPSVSPHSPLSPTSAATAAASAGFFEYAGLPTTASMGQLAASGYEAYLPSAAAAAAAAAATGSAGYIAAPAGYTYGIPQPMSHFTAHYQPQQIQADRLQ